MRWLLHFGNIFVTACAIVNLLSGRRGANCTAASLKIRERKTSLSLHENLCVSVCLSVCLSYLGGDPRFVCFGMIMSLSLMFVIASRPGGVDVPVCRRFFLQSVGALCCPLEHYACSQVFLDVVCLIAEVTRFLAFSMSSLCSTPHLPSSMGISLLCPLAPSCARQNLKVFQFAAENQVQNQQVLLNRFPSIKTCNSDSPVCANDDWWQSLCIHVLNSDVFLDMSM